MTHLIATLFAVTMAFVNIILTCVLVSTIMRISNELRGPKPNDDWWRET